MKKFLIFIAIASIFFSLGMFSELYHIHHQDYRTCKMTEEACDEDFECNLFTKSSYNVYCDALTGYEWQHRYVPYNLTKNIFAHVCREKGDIIYKSNSSDGDIKVMTCLSGQEYKISMTNTNKNTTINGTIKDIPDYITYFKNIETNETYLVNNGSIDVLLAPFEIVGLVYNPEESEKILYIEECKELYIKADILDLDEEEIDFSCKLQYEDYLLFGKINLTWSSSDGIINDDIILYYDFKNNTPEYAKVSIVSTPTQEIKFIESSQLKQFCPYGEIKKYPTDNLNIEFVKCENSIKIINQRPNWMNLILTNENRDIMDNKREILEYYYRNIGCDYLKTNGYEIPKICSYYEGLIKSFKDYNLFFDTPISYDEYYDRLLGDEE